MDTRLPMFFAEPYEWVRRSFGAESPANRISLCVVFWTLFFGLFPVPLALLARILTFVFGHGRGLAIIDAVEGFFSTRAGKITGTVFLTAGAGLFLVVLGLLLWGVILKYGWLYVLVIIVEVAAALGLAIAVIAGIAYGSYRLQEYSDMQKKEGNGHQVLNHIAKPLGGIMRILAVMGHFLIATKKRFCPIYINPLAVEEKAAE